MVQRYTIQKVRDTDGIAEYAVTKDTRPLWECPRVWVGQDRVPRCTNCSGPLAAMSASCAHAKAVKRFIAAEGEGGEVNGFNFC